MVLANPFENFNKQKIKDDRLNNEQKSKLFLEDFFSLPTKSSPAGFLGISLSAKRINIIFLFIILIIFIFLGRAIWLQIILNEYYQNIAEGNRVRIVKTSALRGVIYDRQKNKLVENIANFQLVIIPVDLSRNEEERQKLISWLDEFTVKTKEEIEEIISKQSPFSYNPVIISDDLNYQQALKIEVGSTNFTGAKLVVEPRRHYLATENDYSFSHFLGYLGKISTLEEEDYLALGYNSDDLVGKDGLEKYYQSILMGRDGKKKIEVDAFGNQKEIIAEEKAISGSSLVLTVDSGLQQAAKNFLLNSLKANGKKKGAVVVIEPNYGQILALISLPTYDNNEFASGISADEFNELINNENQPLFNRAVSGQYPSGSTIKPIVGLAALEEGLVDSQTRIISSGGIHVDKWFYPDWRTQGHGLTDIRKALAESVNTYFYLIGGGYEDFKGLGLERLTNYFRLFGLGTKLGIDLPSEADGFIPSGEWKERAKGEPWYIGDTYHLAIGQGDILVTPLQVAAWTATFANYGTLYQPYLVSQLVDEEGRVVKNIKPKVIRQDFVNVENITVIREGLRQAVTMGSAKELLNLSVSSAGKTGTAQWSTEKLSHAWFTGFSPYHNPEIVVTVLIEEGGEGSQIALPVAGEIFQWWADNR